MCETLRGFPPASTWPECPDISVLVNYISKACLYMKEFRLKDIYSKYSANRKSKLHQQFGRATQHIAKKKKKWGAGLFSTCRRTMWINVCACTCLLCMQLSVVSIYACMCRCSPCSTGRCVSHPWGRRSGRESNSSRGRTCGDGPDAQIITLWVQNAKIDG